MAICPCESGRDEEACCAPLLAGERAAATAEELLRSRYTAYVRANVDYLLDTVHPERIDDHDPRSMRKWAEESQWEGLAIDAVEGGGENDDDARIEFVARYRARNGEHVAHHERAAFARHAGRWVFVDGEPVAQKTITRELPKVGRNEPCPCGSGRKYKKCCGAH